MDKGYATRSISFYSEYENFYTFIDTHTQAMVNGS